MFFLKKLVTIRLAYQADRSVRRNIMTIFGIETPSGIYQLRKKTINKPNDIPEFFSNKTIELILPKNGINVHQKLLELYNFSKSSIDINPVNGVVPDHHFNGYMLEHNSFMRALVYVSKNSKFDRTKHLLEAYDVVMLSCYDNKITLRYNSKQHVMNDDAEYEVVLSNDYHPMFDSEDFRPAYYGYQQMITALKNMSHLEGVQELLSVYPNLLTDTKLVNTKDVKLTNNFIVVEGLDGTGKSTMTKNLANHFNSVRMATPPDSIRQIRKKFDHLPELCRRSFYALSNYLAAKDVVEVTQSKSVVMDRYWHSTTSYAIAKEAGCGIEEYLPEIGHTLYTWPFDLLRPTAVVFLTTSEKHRDSRVNERSELTAEEQLISESGRFRARIMEAYKRIGFPKWVEIDTSGTQQQSLQKAVQKLKEVGVT